jgi:ABC-type multidrug transport system fused ATPase/permease subunit
MGFQTMVVLDEVILSEESDAYDRLVAICWLLAGLSVITFALNWLKEYFGKVIQNRMVVEIRCVLSEKIAHLPMAYHARQRTGDLLSRIQNDVAETSRGLEMLFGDILSDPIMILVLTGTCFVVNWRSPTSAASSRRARASARPGRPTSPTPSARCSRGSAW